MHCKLLFCRKTNTMHSCKHTFLALYDSFLIWKNREHIYNQYIYFLSLRKKIFLFLKLVTSTISTTCQHSIFLCSFSFRVKNHRGTDKPHCQKTQKDAKLALKYDKAVVRGLWTEDWTLSQGERERGRLLPPSAVRSIGFISPFRPGRRENQALVLTCSSLKGPWCVGEAARKIVEILQTPCLPSWIEIVV